MRSMKRSEQSGLKALAIIIVVIVVAFSAFRCYYFFTHKGEELVPSLIKRILWSPEEASEDADTELPVRLTVNPNYDGKDRSEEYIYSNIADTDAVIRISQTVTYEYYNSNGNAIKTVNTKSFNAKGKVVSSGYRRESCEMSNTDIKKQVIEIDYRYDTEKIYRDYLITSYTGSGAYWSIVDSASEYSEQNRT